MSDKSSTIPETKRGRKPLGSAAMTPAERKRRSREQSRATGAKEFILSLEGWHLQHVEELAKSQNISTSAALRGILETALDRYVGVMRRCAQLRENGASDEAVEIFVNNHLFPPLPAIDKLEVTSENN
jgi:hypothetical protein